MELKTSHSPVRPGRLAWIHGSLLVVLGALFLGWLFNTPAGPLGKADALGYAVCHRIGERSFHFADGRPLPLCVRCSGMYLGAMLGLAFQALVSGRRSGYPGRGIILVLLLLGLAFAMDGTNSYLALFLGHGLLYEPSHIGRLLTGSGMGLAIAVVFFPAFNDTVWAAADARPALNWRSLAVLGGLTLGVNWLVFTENWWVLYTLAWVSAGGILLLLTLIYLLVVILITKRSGGFQSWRQLVWHGAAALTIALVQIIILDWVRYALTGTWSGFLFG